MSGLTPERWQRLGPLLDQLFEAPEAERPGLVLSLAGGDAELRAELLSLVAAAGVGGILDRSADSYLTRHPGESADSAAAGERVGPWRILDEIGRGGMGVVYLAERADGAFEQRAALKLLRRGIATDEVLERFRRERQILARLEHAHIARLLDGGATEDGRPYLAMEYVAGTPLTSWCDARCLGIGERLRLFDEVCAAVQHAHGRLIVHRDIKPANVLVTDAGATKLLDFGIAKVLDPDEGSFATRTVTRILTPAYAAPEQVRGEPVTTATDVYGLGLVLYELLGGRRALAEAGSTPADLERAILGRDPERPSQSVHADAAAARGTTPDRLRRRLAGDLDTIALTALRKEPEQRYPSVEALRQDIGRHSQGLPVLARRPTLAYRGLKFARRHRWGVAAAAAAVAALCGALFVVARERDRARDAESRAAAVNDFLVHEMLQAATPEKAQGRTLTVADVLGNASRSAPHAFRDQPEMEADVRLALAASYAALGRPGEARGHAEAALRLLAERHGEDGAETLRARRRLGELAIDEGRFAEARQQLEALRARQAALLGPHHPDTLATTASLGRTLHALGDFGAATPLLRDAIGVAQARHPGLWRLAVELQGRLVDVYVDQALAIEAEAVCREMLATQRAALGPEHPEVARTLARLAAALYKQLRHADAAAASEQVVALHERLYGKEHPATGDALMELARVYDHGLFRYGDALATYERAREVYRLALGPDHPKALRAFYQAGLIHRLGGRMSEAEAIYREVLAIRRRSLGELHPDTIRIRLALNAVLVATGRLDEARETAGRAFEASEAVVAAPGADPAFVAEHAERLMTIEPEDLRDRARALALAGRAVAATARKHPQPLRVLGLALARNGRPEQAIATLREALALPDGVRSWTAEAALVDLLREHAAPEQLEALLLERLERQRVLRGESERLAAKTLRFLALHYERMGRSREAELRFAETLAQLRKSCPESDWEVGRAKSELGERLAARHALQEAERLLLEGHATLAADERTAAGMIADARARLVRLYEAWGRAADAARWRKAGRAVTS
jgi:serine/threonine-protein kinase